MEDMAYCKPSDRNLGRKLPIILEVGDLTDLPQTVTVWSRLG